MDRPGQPNSHAANDRQRLQSLADTLHEAWKHATSVDLLRFLPPASDPLRRAALTELIKVDLTIRWQRQQPIFLETYLKRFPELGPAARLPQDLILEEFRARQMHGEPPQLDDYRRRFPTQYPAIERCMRDAPTEAAGAAVQAVLPRQDVANAATVAQPSKPAPQQTVKGFKLFKKLGSGSFAEVWQGESPGGFPVAIKRIIKQLDDSQAQRELQALESIKKLRHPFLLQTQDSFVLDNQLYVVMELADGTLRDRQKQYQKQGRKAIPLTELLCIFAEAAEALDYMHRQRLLHRDIKPANILVLNGHAKVADFGLAMLHESHDLLLTASGSGTPAYMAPEVWHRKISPHSDQYSLAFTYAEQRLGRWVFAGSDIVSLMRDHLETDPNLDPLPASEQVVLRKALAKDPKQRYPSCLAFMRALEQAVEEEVLAEVAQAGPGQPGVATPSGRRHRGGDSRTRADGTRADASNPSATVAIVAPPPPSRGRWLGMLLMLVFAVAASAGAAWWVVNKRDLRSTPPPFELVDPAQLSVSAGGVGTLALKVKRHNFNGEINLTLDGMPVAYQTDDLLICEDLSELELPLLIGPQVAPSEYQVTIKATAPDQPPSEVKWSLRVRAPLYRLPPGAEPRGPLKVDTQNRAYYDRIVLVRDGVEVPFVLVRRLGNDDPPTIYIMEDKVWIALYRQFTRQPAAKLRDPQWVEQPDNKTDADCPAMLRSVADAEQFARWLGGELPTAKQWDKAAGRFEKDRGPGPYPEALAAQVAVGLKQPRKTHGTDSQVRSPFGCRDMAGNGLEWTATKFGTDQNERTRDLDKLRADDDTVFVRGWAFAQTRPYRYADDEKLEGGRVLPPSIPQTNVGFRVVVEPRD